MSPLLKVNFATNGAALNEVNARILHLQYPIYQYLLKIKFTQMTEKLLFGVDSIIVPKIVNNYYDKDEPGF
jgi:hypothetical protein